MSASLSVINGSTVSGNHATRGGGIFGRYNQTVAMISTVITIDNSTVENNTAVESFFPYGVGGGVDILGGSGFRDSATLTILNSMLSGNLVTGGGGGIYTSYSNHLSVINSTLSGNSAERPGGGISTYMSDSVSLINSTLSGNLASNAGGGGISARYSDHLSVINTTLSGNSASYGAGIVFNSTFRTNIQNCTLSSNSAVNRGGGIAALSAFSLNIQNSTLSDNMAGVRGGGIYASDSGPLGIVNSIISGNRGNGTGDEIYGDNANFLATSGNLFGDDTTSFTAAFVNFSPTLDDFIATGTINQIGTTNPDSTPLSDILSPLADNGCAILGPDGCVKTHALVPNSPAINTADNAICPATDQRGEPRDAKCDIGAFEFINDEMCYVINTVGSKTIVFCL